MDIQFRSGLSRLALKQPTGDTLFYTGDAATPEGWLTLSNEGQEALEYLINALMAQLEGDEPMATPTTYSGLLAAILTNTLTAAKYVTLAAFERDALDINAVLDDDAITDETPIDAFGGLPAGVARKLVGLSDAITFIWNLKPGEMEALLAIAALARGGSVPTQAVDNLLVATLLEERNWLKELTTISRLMEEAA